jgi:hypothetical protein
MERIAKNLSAVICALLVVGCGHNPPKPPERVVVEAPKPNVDARILEVCDVYLTPIADTPEPYELFVSYKETIDKLNACSCRQREARNALCKLTSPGCNPVPSCKVPNESPKQ